MRAEASAPRIALTLNRTNSDLLTPRLLPTIPSSITSPWPRQNESDIEQALQGLRNGKLSLYSRCSAGIRPHTLTPDTSLPWWHFETGCPYQTTAIDCRARPGIGYEEEKKRLLALRKRRQAKKKATVADSELRVTDVNEIRRITIAHEERIRSTLPFLGSVVISLRLTAPYSFRQIPTDLCDLFSGCLTTKFDNHGFLKQLCRLRDICLNLHVHFHWDSISGVITSC